MYGAGANGSFSRSSGDPLEASRTRPRLNGQLLGAETQHDLSLNTSRAQLLALARGETGSFGASLSSSRLRAGGTTFPAAAQPQEQQSMSNSFLGKSQSRANLLEVPSLSQSAFALNASSANHHPVANQPFINPRQRLLELSSSNLRASGSLLGQPNERGKENRQPSHPQFQSSGLGSSVPSEYEEALQRSRMALDQSVSVLNASRNLLLPSQSATAKPKADPLSTSMLSTTSNLQPSRQLFNVNTHAMRPGLDQSQLLNVSHNLDTSTSLPSMAMPSTAATQRPEAKQKQSRAEDSLFTAKHQTGSALSVSMLADSDAISPIEHRSGSLSQPSVLSREIPPPGEANPPIKRVYAPSGPELAAIAPRTAELLAKREREKQQNHSASAEVSQQEQLTTSVASTKPHTVDPLQQSSRAAAANSSLFGSLNQEVMLIAGDSEPLVSEGVASPRKPMPTTADQVQLLRYGRALSPLNETAEEQVPERNSESHNQGKASDSKSKAPQLLSSSFSTNPLVHALNTTLTRRHGLPIPISVRSPPRRSTAERLATFQTPATGANTSQRSQPQDKIDQALEESGIFSSDDENIDRSPNARPDTMKASPPLSALENPPQVEPSQAATLTVPESSDVKDETVNLGLSQTEPQPVMNTPKRRAKPAATSTDAHSTPRLTLPNVQTRMDPESAAFIEQIELSKAAVAQLRVDAKNYQLRAEVAEEKVRTAVVEKELALREAADVRAELDNLKKEVEQRPFRVRNSATGAEELDLAALAGHARATTVAALASKLCSKVLMPYWLRWRLFVTKAKMETVAEFKAEEAVRAAERESTARVMAERKQAEAVQRDLVRRAIEILCERKRSQSRRLRLQEAFHRWRHVVEVRKDSILRALDTIITRQRAKLLTGGLSRWRVAILMQKEQEASRAHEVMVSKLNSEAKQQRDMIQQELEAEREKYAESTQILRQFAIETQIKRKDEARLIQAFKHWRLQATKSVSARRAAVEKIGLILAELSKRQMLRTFKEWHQRTLKSTFTQRHDRVIKLFRAQVEHRISTKRENALHRAFYLWRDYVRSRHIQKQLQYDRLGRAVDNFWQSRARATFIRWRFISAQLRTRESLNAQRAHHRELLLKRVLLIPQRQMLRAGLEAFKRNVLHYGANLARVRLLQAAERQAQFLASNKTKARLRVAFHDWREYARVRKLQHNALEAASRAGRVYGLRIGFTRWKRGVLVAQQKDKARELLAQMDTRKERLLNVARAQCEALARSKATTTLASAFSAWRLVTEESRAIRDRMRLKVFSVWREFARMKREQHEQRDAALNRVVQSYRRSMMKQAWLTWAKAVSNWHRVQHVKLVQELEAKHNATVEENWKRMVENNAKLRSYAAQLCGDRSRRAAMKAAQIAAFTKWRLYAASMKVRRVQLAKKLLHASDQHEMQTRLAFQHWRMVTAATKEKRQVLAQHLARVRAEALTKIINRASIRLQVRALGLWKAFVLGKELRELHQSYQQQLGRASTAKFDLETRFCDLLEKRRNRLRLTDAFIQFRQWATERRAYRQRLEEAAKRFNMWFLRKEAERKLNVLHKWNLAVKLIQAKERANQRLIEIEAAAAEQNEANLATTARLWQEHVDNLTTQHEVEKQQALEAEREKMHQLLETKLEEALQKHTESQNKLIQQIQDAEDRLREERELRQAVERQLEQSTAEVALLRSALESKDVEFADVKRVAAERASALEMTEMWARQVHSEERRTRGYERATMKRRLTLINAFAIWRAETKLGLEKRNEIQRLRHLACVQLSRIVSSATMNRLRDAFDKWKTFCRIRRVEQAAAARVRALVEAEASAARQETIKKTLALTIGSVFEDVQLGAGSESAKRRRMIREKSLLIAAFAVWRSQTRESRAERLAHSYAQEQALRRVVVASCNRTLRAAWSRWRHATSQRREESNETYWRGIRKELGLKLAKSLGDTKTHDQLRSAFAHWRSVALAHRAHTATREAAIARQELEAARSEIAALTHQVSALRMAVQVREREMHDYSESQADLFRKRSLLSKGLVAMLTLFWRRTAARKAIGDLMVTVCNRRARAAFSRWRLLTHLVARSELIHLAQSTAAEDEHKDAVTVEAPENTGPYPVPSITSHREHLESYRVRTLDPDEVRQRHIFQLAGLDPDSSIQLLHEVQQSQHGRGSTTRQRPLNTSLTHGTRAPEGYRRVGNAVPETNLEMLSEFGDDMDISTAPYGVLNASRVSHHDKAR